MSFDHGGRWSVRHRWFRHDPDDVNRYRGSVTTIAAGLPGPRGRASRLSLLSCYFFGATINTVQGACALTCRAVSPSAISNSPRLLWLPITSRSASISDATSTMTCREQPRRRAETVSWILGADPNRLDNLRTHFLIWSNTRISRFVSQESVNPSSFESGAVSYVPLLFSRRRLRSKW